MIYQKDGAGYIAYSKDENGKAKTENVPGLPAGASVWVLDTFVTGGVCIINGHRFELSPDIVYAIEYYEDTELKTNSTSVKSTSKSVSISPSSSIRTAKHSLSTSTLRTAFTTPLRARINIR